MWHQFILGLLLGWGAAIPIGPMNLEMIRRNLNHGAMIGFSLGLGACLADVTYLVFLSMSAFAILRYPIVMVIVSILGALILFYFGLATLKQKPPSELDKIKVRSPKQHWVTLLQGYVLTLVNPYTILFWASVSAQVAILSQGLRESAIALGLGVLMATVSWVVLLNTVVHQIRHKLSKQTIHRLNYFGASLLILFAIMSLYHVFK